MRIASKVVMWVAALAFVAFWTLLWTERIVRSKALQTIAESQQPMVLNGLGLFSEHQLAPLANDSSCKAHLLFAVSDSCPRSRPAAAELVSFLRDGAPDATCLAIVSLNGSQVASELAEVTRAIAKSSTVVLDDVISFTQHTGIGSTPMIVLADGLGRVRLVGNSLSPRFGALIRSATEQYR